MMEYLADHIFTTTWDETRKIFFSIEPILEKIKLYVIPDWVIIGAETGNRKDKIIPKFNWIEEILIAARIKRIPVFMKNNLSSVWNGELIQEYPIWRK